MFILHLWITENQEQSHIQSCDLSQPHGQEEHTCAAVWAHTTGQHTPKKEPQSDFITFSSAFYNNKKKKANEPNQKPPWYILGCSKARTLFHPNVSLKPREQSHLPGMSRWHPEEERETEKRKNSSWEKLGISARNFSPYNYLGRITAELEKRSNQKPLPA